MVWFYEVKNDGFDPDKIQGGVRPETPEKNDIPGLLAAWNQYKTSDFRVPPGEAANKILPPGSEEPRSWWATHDTLEAGDFNLTASRYKPQIGETVPNVDPAELIRETLAIEREIADGLEKLLKEIES
ncbi:MAG: hypothetical protein P8X90_30790 [Desulfobacterales bacterium]